MRFVVWAFSATPLSCPTAYSSTLAFQVSFSLSLMGWTRFFLSELLKLSPQQSLTFTLHSGSARCFHGQLLWTTRKSRRRAGTASLSRDDVFPALLAQQHVREQILAGWQPTLSITSGELSSFGHAPPRLLIIFFRAGRWEGVSLGKVLPLCRPMNSFFFALAIRLISLSQQLGIREFYSTGHAFSPAHLGG